MGRLLVIIVIVVLAVWLIRKAIRKSQGEVEVRQKPSLEGDLVACAHCGVNLPREEARTVGADLYCSEAHARLGKK